MSHNKFSRALNFLDLLKSFFPRCYEGFRGIFVFDNELNCGYCGASVKGRNVFIDCFGEIIGNECCKVASYRRSEIPIIKEKPRRAT